MPRPNDRVLPIILEMSSKWFNTTAAINSIQCVQKKQDLKERGYTWIQMDMTTLLMWSLEQIT